MSTIEIRNNTQIGVPHTWIIVAGPDGVSRGWGFYPATNGSPNDAGTIMDDTRHEWTSSTEPIDISDEAYQRIEDYVNESRANPPPYAIAWGSQCATWAINAAITAAGGEWLPEYPDMEPNGFWEDIKETIIWNPYTIEIAINVNRNWNTAVTWRPRDPLAIDLDSDGLETLSVTPTPILLRPQRRRHQDRHRLAPWRRRLAHPRPQRQRHHRLRPRTVRRRHPNHPNQRPDPQRPHSGFDALAQPGHQRRRPTSTPPDAAFTQVSPVARPQPGRRPRSEMNSPRWPTRASLPSR